MTKPKADTEMWINATSIIAPSDTFLADLGRDVVAKLKDSANRTGKQDFDPWCDVTIRFTAS